MDEAAFDILMTEVGPLDDGILACIKTQDGAYALRFEEVDVLVERDIDRERIALSVEIGPVRASNALAIYETLLSYNLLWRETGGVRMALTGRQGNVVMFVDLTGSEINARTIATVAGNLQGIADVWRTYLQSAEAGEAVVPASVDAIDFIRI